MITAWDVYWVMQLDSIGAALTFGAIAAGLTAIGGLIGRVMALDFARIYEDSAYPDGKRSYDRYMANAKAWGRACRFSIPASVVLVLAAAFLPSSKTAAAMIVLPALTSEEVTEPLTREAGELYRLAKKALEQAVEAEPEKEAAE